MGERKSLGTVSYTPGKMDSSTPTIKVSGNWLKEQGFMVGDKLNITTMEGEIRIWKKRRWTQMTKMYEFSKEEDVKDIVAKLKWHFKDDPEQKTDGDLDGMFIEQCYSGVQTFGCTDYHDHRQDSHDKLKKLILPHLLEGHQLGNYYDKESKPVEDIVASGYRGGYTAKFLYKSGKSYFGY